MKLTPSGWSDFQHYKDRNPPWIRLHKKLLDNYEFQCLPVASRALAPMLWLLASESMSGEIDADPAKLAFRLRQSVADVVDALNPLIQAGFFSCEGNASDALAERKQFAVPEAEAEAEAVARTARPAKSSTPKCPDDVEIQVWTDWLTLRKSKRAPVTLTVLDGARTEAGKAGMTLEAFLRVWCRRGSQGLEASWLKEHERTGSATTARQAEVAKWLGPLAPKPQQGGEIIDMEVANGTRRALC